ncbi:hypothetical protein ACWGJT_03790 [Streptomyces xantholiticus]
MTTIEPIAAPLKLVEDEAALVFRRTALTGGEPGPDQRITINVDEASATLVDPAHPAHELLAGILRAGRWNGVHHVPKGGRMPLTQYPTVAEWTKALERRGL